MCFSLKSTPSPVIVPSTQTPGCTSANGSTTVPGSNTALALTRVPIDMSTVPTRKISPSSHQPARSASGSTTQDVP
ncbi:hypothetical protein BDV36DRAFT_255033 [Aspergillus pseudocaelatus]|uniref:REJ domain-containing protein n=1 Tax=Aspergillus pseudocaelatus TaxID=1825620 RepID=A0ABQ6WPI5_9EURO|nr:hypothetical protein BDV36DRAFT_255033 [Aspergillus pseudocaelatus]